MILRSNVTHKKRQPAGKASMRRKGNDKAVTHNRTNAMVEVSALKVRELKTRSWEFKWLVEDLTTPPPPPTTPARLPLSGGNCDVRPKWANTRSFSAQRLSNQ